MKLIIKLTLVIMSFLLAVSSWAGSSKKVVHRSYSVYFNENQRIKCLDIYEVPKHRRLVIES